MGAVLRTRQGPFANNNNEGTNNGYNGYGGYNPKVNWWWTPAGMAVRYAIVAILFGSLLLFFFGGYWHAQRRMRQGKPLLAYHRWMVRQRPYYPPAPQYAQQQYGDPNSQNFGMENYPPPPPAYNNAEGPPPVYQPPQGATKAMADQNFNRTIQDGQGSANGGVTAPSAAARL